jgi:hypothetical protein
MYENRPMKLVEIALLGEEDLKGKGRGGEFD